MDDRKGGSCGPEPLAVTENINGLERPGYEFLTPDGVKGGVVELALGDRVVCVTKQGMDLSRPVWPGQRRGDICLGYIPHSSRCYFTQVKMYDFDLVTGQWTDFGTGLVKRCRRWWELRLDRAGAPHQERY